ncbi:aminodeoxychorismate lyase [Acidipropionibacterium virtanenii]|uniref:D-alanine aminotransferase n=1 Tax=Acidipropionibacterium virtanenii TaxID=2057246 RepID=A0A344UQ84_9ACTN|nr:aminodeoxychorismate lyase [Acidipropionibacterium virtanenii]AXE37432.1 D-alanine aminotransferase [Acidipropionibacterium virtanenii]
MPAEQSLLVAVLGRGPLPRPVPVATADDLGLTRGDGVFESIRVVTAANGTSTAQQIDEHLARLSRSVAGIGGPTPDTTAWQRLIEEIMGAWRFPGEAVLKLMITGGPGVLPGAPLGIATISRTPESWIDARDGIDVTLLSRGYRSDSFAEAPWLLGGVKTLSSAVNMAAEREAAARGVDDVIFTSLDGYLLEAPTSGLVVCDAGALVTTPTGATGILGSITVDIALSGADEDGVETSSRLLRPEELESVDGAWLLDSTTGVAPILTVDGSPVRQDPGMTGRLRHWAGFQQ